MYVKSIALYNFEKAIIFELEMVHETLHRQQVAEMHHNTQRMPHSCTLQVVATFIGVNMLLTNYYLAA